MVLALQAGLWGLVSGSALLIGAGIGWFVNLPQRLIAAIMAFGAGVGPRRHWPSARCSTVFPNPS